MLIDVISVEQYTVQQCFFSKMASITVYCYKHFIISMNNLVSFIVPVNGGQCRQKRRSYKCFNNSLSSRSSWMIDRNSNPITDFNKSDGLGFSFLSRGGISGIYKSFETEYCPGNNLLLRSKLELISLSFIN